MKALALISGGLDSMLAAKLIINQGIHVEGINFYTGFAGDQPRCHANCTLNTIASPSESPTPTKLFSARWVGEQLGVKVHVVDVSEEFKPVLQHPQFGYGANLNPCLDCKLFMVNQAKKWLDQNGFDFLVTGEVLGQRPKSQRKDTLPIVAQNTDDRLLRPLSAKLLAPTLPEREGWVNRVELHGISGRSRKPQIALAKQLGIKVYPQPAGGCVLTDESFCHRLRDLWQHKESKDYTLDEITLLKHGRHIRPAPDFKLVVGRDEADNQALEKFTDQYYSLHPANDVPGPLVLFVDGEVDAANLELAARVTARFCKAKNAESVAVSVREPTGRVDMLVVKPMSTDEVPGSWYI